MVIIGKFSCFRKVLGKLQSHRRKKRRTRGQQVDSAVRLLINHAVDVLGSPNADFNGLCGPETGADGQNLDSGSETGVGGGLDHRLAAENFAVRRTRGVLTGNFPGSNGEYARKLENVKVAASSETRFAQRTP